jgi:hypothetical protein
MKNEFALKLGEISSFNDLDFKQLNVENIAQDLPPTSYLYVSPKTLK